MQGKRSPGKVKRPWGCLITQGGAPTPKQVGSDNSGVCTDIREQRHIVISCMLFNIISSNTEETTEETCGKSMRLRGGVGSNLSLILPGCSLLN